MGVARTGLRLCVTGEEGVAEVGPRLHHGVTDGQGGCGAKGDGGVDVWPAAAPRPARRRGLSTIRRGGGGRKRGIAGGAHHMMGPRGGAAARGCRRRCPGQTRRRWRAVQAPTARGYGCGCDQICVTYAERGTVCDLYGAGNVTSEPRVRSPSELALDAVNGEQRSAPPTPGLMARTPVSRPVRWKWVQYQYIDDRAASVWQMEREKRAALQGHPDGARWCRHMRGACTSADILQCTRLSVLGGSRLG